MSKAILFFAACASVALAQSPLTITTASPLASAIVNQPYSAQLAASGGAAPYTWRFQANGNPSPRFSLSTSGSLTGSPIAADAGVLTFTVQVTDVSGLTVAKQLSVGVQTTAPLTLTTTAFPPGTLGVPYSFQLTAIGGTPPYKWEVQPAIVTLPTPGQVSPGLTLDSATGLVTGTPASVGSFAFTITLTDRANGSFSKPFTVRISAGGPLGILTSYLADGVLGAPYSQSLDAEGGVPPYKWAAEGLPRGLALDTAKGIISGAPLDTGTSNVTLIVTDSAATPATSRHSTSIKVVAPPPLLLTTTSLPDGVQGVPYTGKLAASGGVSPYRWDTTAGTLPAGLELDSQNGLIRGTPAATGSSTFTIRVTDSAAGVAAQATKTFTFAVARLTEVSVVTGPLPAGTAETPYSQILKASGGAPPYSWSILAGTLPPGLLLGESGTLSGVPAVPAEFPFTAKVVDASGASAVGAISVAVAPKPLAIVNFTLPAAVSGTTYPSQVMKAVGGIPPYEFSVESSGAVSVSASGLIDTAPSTPGTYPFTAKVTDAAKSSATAQFQLLVRPSLPVDLILSAGSLSFAIAPGASTPPAPQAFTIASSNVNTPIAYQVAASPAAPWLNITGGTSGTTPGNLTVSLTSAALDLPSSNTPYTTTITITCATSSPCAGTSQKIVVSVSVTSPPPQLSFTTSLVALTSYPADRTATGLLGIQNAGGGSIDVTSVKSSDSWLALDTPPATLASGSPVYLKLVATAPQATPGRLYRTTVTVVTSAGSANIPVTLLVAAGPGLTLNPAGSQFQMAFGGAVGNPDGAVQILLGGASSANWTAATLPGTPWLVVKQPSGTSTPSAPGVLTYSIDPPVAAGLSPGTYYGRIRITSSQVVNTPLDFLVVLNVAPAGTPPQPQLEPAGLVFISNGTGTTPAQALTLYASSVTPVPYQASASTTTGASWLSVFPTTGAASATSPGRPVVSVNPAGLSPGIYRGVVTYQFSAAAMRSVSITYIVPSLSGGLPFFERPEFRPRATCSPTRVVATATGLPASFVQPASWPTLLSVQLSDDCGTAIPDGRIDVTFSNGDPPVGLSADLANPGRYSATWVPRNPVSQVTVTAFAAAPGLASARTQISGKVTPNVAPALNPGGMLNVFNPLLGAGIAPGTAVQIYGANLALPGTVEGASSVPFPTSLKGTSVVIAGIQAPLYFVSPGQINALAPFELQPGVPYQVLVSVNGALTTPDTFTATPGAPGIAAFQNGNIIAQHANATLITEAAPAKPGEIIVLFLAGLGSAQNQPVAGTGAPLPPTEPLNPITLTVAGKTASTLFVGLTPGSVGLYQINFAVPAETPEGSQTLTVTQAGAASNVTILPVRK